MIPGLNLGKLLQCLNQENKNLGEGDAVRQGRSAIILENCQELVQQAFQKGRVYLRAPTKGYVTLYYFHQRKDTYYYLITISNRQIHPTQGSTPT